MNRLLLHLRPLSTSTTTFPLRSLSTTAATTSSSSSSQQLEEANGNGKVAKTLAKETDPGSHRDMRRAFYIDGVVDKVINRSLGHPFLMWTRTRAEFYRLLKSKRGCRLFRSNTFVYQIRSTIRGDELDSKKRFGAHKICLGRFLSDHSRIKRDLYRYKYLSLAKKASDDAFLGSEKGELSQS